MQYFENKLNLKENSDSKVNKIKWCNNESIVAISTQEGQLQLFKSEVLI